MPEIPFIQIAGVIDPYEAELLTRCGVPYLGFPLRLPVHQEDLSEAEAARIIAGLRPPHFGVLITYLDQANEILAFCQELGVQHVQLHGDIAASELKKLRRAAPGLCLIKSLVVRAGNLSELRHTVQTLAPDCDYFITDTFDPQTGASGATGKTHDWAISRELVDFSPRPVILAGGLRPENIREAILAVRPAGVDAHTGVEGADGRKDADLVAAFMAGTLAAYRELGGQSG